MANTVTYAIINNIPSSYKSSDLRSFFSQLVESNAFRCFHFRHRPEVQVPLTESNPSADQNQNNPNHQKRDTCCCVVLVRNERLEELLTSYDKSFWLNADGETMMSRCHVRKISIAKHSSPSDQYVLKGDSQTTHQTETLCESDLRQLKELHPPVALPAGNVGTPTRYIVKQINECKFPAQLIRKLGLEFPRLRAKGVYGNVALNYDEIFPKRKKRSNGSEGASGSKKGLFRVPDLSCIPSDVTTFCRTTKGHIVSSVGGNPKRPPVQEEVEKDEKSDSDDGEEWDRHEALNNDVTSQERTKERLFEEDLEVVWEKGGSGLVFYTDAQHWDEAAGDFDAKTSDDWDVDMSVYYQDGAGDKDARDFVSMEHFKALRKGTETEDDNRIGYFEKFTKGIGRRILERQGWKDGKGVGVREGMAEPIRDEGQHPSDKSGFGYRGEKIVRQTCRRGRDDDEYAFSSVYDAKFRDEGHGLTGRAELPSILKYRQPFVKKKK